MGSKVDSSAPWIRARTSAATAGLNGIIPPAWEQGTRAAMLARAGSLLVSASASARRGESAGGEDGVAESRTGRNGGEAK